MSSLTFSAQLHGHTLAKQITRCANFRFFFILRIEVAGPSMAGLTTAVTSENNIYKLRAKKPTRRTNGRFVLHSSGSRFGQICRHECYQAPGKSHVFRNSAQATNT